MTRVDLPSLYPPFKDETDSAWTARLLGLAREYGTNRQCSINWHEECSDPQGESCQCYCHEEGVGIWSVEAHPEGDEQVVTRVVQGKVMMPPQPGEPEGTWADWVLAKSEPDATERAIERKRKQGATADA